MLLILLIAVSAGFAEALLVRTDQGTLSGTVLRSRNGQEFYGFYGIPYAQPPTGELRFQPPKMPPPSWNVTKNATQKPPACPQVKRSSKDSKPQEKFSQSEDCLFLQVFTKNVDDAALQPVVVFFHGGAFVEGSSTQYEPTFLMDKPIVMVAVNYRLGVLGFLSAGEASYPGNYGLKDQSAALQWVQKNIRAFGGDPSAVTLLGHSAGSQAVHLHTMSPLSKGTFHRAILQSGTGNAFSSFSSSVRARKVFQTFKEHVNCSRPTTNEIVACLMALPVGKLLESASTYRGVDTNKHVFHPVIEPYGSEGAFLPSNPTQFAYLDSGIPLMFGFASNEGLSLFGKGSSAKPIMNCTDEKAFETDLLKKLNYDPKRDHESLGKKTIALVKQFYFGNNFSYCDFNTTVTVFSDMLFKFAVLQSISTYPYQSYAYEYDHRALDSPLSRKYGVGHGEELRILIPDTGAKPLDDVDRRFSDTVVTYWTNFILSGNPNSPNQTMPTEWSPAKILPDENPRIMCLSNDGFQMRNESVDEQLKLFTYYSKIFWR